MNLSDPIVLLILGVPALVAGLWLARHFLSPEARWERRRRRSNRPVASTVRRPMVKFSVRMEKDRRT